MRFLICWQSVRFIYTKIDPITDPNCCFCILRWNCNSMWVSFFQYCSIWINVNVLYVLCFHLFCTCCWSDNSLICVCIVPWIRNSWTILPTGKHCKDNSLCRDNDTCCPDELMGFSCCPQVQGVCCDDNKSCCPYGCEVCWRRHWAKNI